jgi:hypothetical protein
VRFDKVRLEVAMTHIIQLKDVLSTHLPWHGARLNFLAMFLVALFKVKTVNLAEIATALNPNARTGSNHRRLQRFFADFELDYDLIAKLVTALVPQTGHGYVLSLDRTNWQFGRFSINLLVLAIVHQGVAFPVYWMFLDKEGNSNTAERIAIMEKFMTTFGASSIAWLLADREFVGKKWFKFLRQQKIPFRIRIKQNFQVSGKKGQIPVMAIFQHLTIGETLILPRKRFILGQALYLIGLRLEDEYLLLVTDQKPQTALEDYAKRWNIETLFGILKSRGFRFEETHLTDGERINKLLALLTLATIWAFKVGQWLHQQEPLKLKIHGRLTKSIFRYGLDFLRATVFYIQLKMDDFQFSLTFLSCT